MSLIATTTPTSWQEQLANTINDIDTLANYLNLDKQTLDKICHSPKKFGLKLTHSFADKMTKGDINDPLLKQILPNGLELQSYVGFCQDPLHENDSNPIKGLLHKYPSRVLITLTGACAVHCRYCFRRHFDYGANVPTASVQDAIMAYIRADSGIDEVIFSGGDPLSVSNRRLGEWLVRLNDVPTIKTIRLHTRLPVVLPDRVDDELLAMFEACDKKLVMVLHINHPNEIDDRLKSVCQDLCQKGVMLLNQSVLLKDINDNAQVLADLSHKLFDCGILPYYLHVLDKVDGAGHFLVEDEMAVAIYWQLLEKLSGYLVPKLVRELHNKSYKTPINLYK